MLPLQQDTHFIHHIMALASTIRQDSLWDTAQQESQAILLTILSAWAEVFSAYFSLYTQEQIHRIVVVP